MFSTGYDGDNAKEETAIFSFEGGVNPSKVSG
jgi:hypothetical protein